MSAFALICNPVRVWDFRAYFASKPEYGYWCVTQKVYRTAEPGDRLYLRVTSADTEPGVHGRFVVERKGVEEVEDKFWRKGSHPVGPVPVLWFRNESPGMLARPLSVSRLKSLLPPDSRLIRVPQAKATELSESEADTLDGIILRP